MRFVLSIWFCALTYIGLSQFTYDYIRQPNSFSSSIAGGVIVSSSASDLSAWMDNPALLDSTTQQHAAILINPYFSDIARYGVTASWITSKVDHLMAGILYNSYGQFDRLDLTGNQIGNFSGRSYTIQFGASHKIGLFQLGTGFKYSGILLESTSASLILMDFGGSVKHPSKSLSAGLSIRNFGWVVNEPVTLSSSRLPFDVVLGLTFKPTYMPFRFTLTAYDLPRANEEVVPDELARDRVFSPVLRFVNPSLALVLGDLMELQLGYNYRINETLRLQNAGFGAGWSFGFKLLLSKYQIMIARNTYQATGGTTFITLQTDYRTIKNIF